MPELSPYIAKRPDNFVAAMMESWLETNSKLFDFETENSTRCFRINYEKLVTEPGTALPLLFNFIGTGWNDALLAAIFKTPHDQGEGDIKVWLSKEISNDSIGNGGSLPESFLPADLAKKVDDLHKKLGYPQLKSYYSSDNASNNVAIKNNKEPTKRQITTRDISDIIIRRQDEFKTMRGICNLVVQGAEGGEWWMDFSALTPTVETGRANQADCTLTISSSSMIGILDGNLSVIEAYEQGEVASAGNLSLTIQFGTLLLGGHEKQ